MVSGTANENYRADPVLRSGVVRLMVKRQREAADLLGHLDAITTMVENWRGCPIAHDHSTVAATLHEYRRRVRRMAEHLIIAPGNDTYVGNVAAFLTEHEARRIRAEQPKEANR